MITQAYKLVSHSTILNHSFLSAAAVLPYAAIAQETTTSDQVAAVLGVFPHSVCEAQTVGCRQSPSVGRRGVDPTAGNTVIVGHDDPFEAATGAYPELQGATYVVLPDGAGGFEVLGLIGPNDWLDAM